MLFKYVSFAAVSTKVIPVGVANTGASSTAVILIDTVATAESAVPSFTLKVNESFPVAFAVGV